MFSKKTIIFVSRNLTQKIMKIEKNYNAPAIEVVECAVECGFGGSDTTIPDYDNNPENDL